MAITIRKGPYDKFDAQKLQAGEIVMVTEGDPHASDGRAVYVCFSPGDVKRMATYEDMVENVDASCKEVIDRHIDEKTGAALEACKEAAKAAQDAAKGTILAKSDAELAAADAQNAAGAANEAAEKALEAVKKCEGLTDNTRITALENTIKEIKEALKNVLATE